MILWLMDFWENGDVSCCGVAYNESHTSKAKKWVKRRTQWEVLP